METYNHFDYGRQIATRLKPISHTPEKPRYFTAFGIEDLYSLDDKLSSVRDKILIAVDGHESTSTDNQDDSLNDRQAYSFIVAGSTVSDRPETITQTTAECRVIAKQIRNHLFQAPLLSDTIDRTTQINGIGPIGDNFYGVILTFFLNIQEEFIVDSNFWNE